MVASKLTNKQIRESHRKNHETLIQYFNLD
jgi:hypothetical protein